MKPKFVLVLVTLMLVVIPHVPVNAAQIDPFEVNDTRDLGEVRPGDGICDNGDGGCSLRAAIEEANVFGPNNNVPVEIEIIPSLGTFLLEKEITVATRIILYGNGNTISGAEKTRLFNITEKGDFSLTAVTLSDGASDGAGGAISNAGTLQLDQCAFLSNKAGKSGGAIYTTRGSKLLIFGGSEFSHNGAVHGGAIHNQGGYTLIIEGLLHQNFAAGDRGSGGAIYTDREGITDISWSTLVDNSASFGGGAIQSGGPDSGAALWMHDSTVSNNRAYRGGGLSSRDSDLEIRRSTFSGNVVAEHGGGLFLYEVYAGTEIKDIVNSTISGNSAGQDGGGFYLVNITDVNLSNVTITQNIADSDGDQVGQGGGIFETRNSYNPPSLTMQNTLLAGNIDGSGQPTTDAPDCAGVLRSKGYNLIGELNLLCKITGTTTGNQVGTIAIPLDPMLDVLQPLGNKLIHPLLPGSPAIDAGSTTGCVDNQGALLTWDQPGTLRPLDGDGDSIEICDIGAVEYTP